MYTHVCASLLQPAEHAGALRRRRPRAALAPPGVPRALACVCVYVRVYMYIHYVYIYI